jgi:hypothetical protein
MFLNSITFILIIMIIKVKEQTLFAIRIKENKKKGL